MGHSLSADKRERQNLKRRARNRYNAVALKKSMKTFTAAVAEGKADKKTLDSAFKALDIEIAIFKIGIVDVSDLDFTAL